MSAALGGRSTLSLEPLESAVPLDKQNLPRWFVAAAISVVIYSFAALAIFTEYSRLLGGILLLPVGALVVLGFVRADWGRPAAAREARRGSVAGRIITVIEVVAAVYVLFLIGRWLNARL